MKAKLLAGLAALSSALCIVSSSANGAGRAVELCRNAKEAAAKIQFCTSAIEQTSDRRTLERLFLRRGNSFMEVGLYANAVTDFSNLISFNRKVAGYFDNRMNAYKAMGRFKEALGDANAAVALAPNKAFVFRSRGGVWESLEKYQPAIADFDRAVALDPDDLGLRVDRARIKVKARQITDAINDLSRVLDVDPNNAGAHRERGLAFKEAGDRTRAIADLRPYAEANPSDQEVARAMMDLREVPDGGSSGPQLPNAERAPKPTEPKGDQIATGTGFFISADGAILTNAHVVEGCSSVQARTARLSTDAAVVLARDAGNDIALLKIAGGDKPPTYGEFRSGVRIGETIAVFGFPLYGLLASGGNFTVGNVSATAGLSDDTRFLQISAPVQPGNSGGPVLDQHGNVVGIVVSKLNVFKLASIIEDVPQNVNFAIKTGVIANFLETTPVSPTLTSDGSGSLSLADLAERAKSISVFLTCSR